MEKSTGKTIKTFSSRMQARLLLVFCITALLMVGLMGRLIYIMQTDGDRFTKQVLSRQSYVSDVLPYKRGEIMDRNGTVLARSELQYKLILDPKFLLQNPDCIPTTMAALKEGFNLDDQTVQGILDGKPNSQYVIALKNLKYDEVEAFKAKIKEVNKEKNKIIGVWFEEDYVRSYPYNTLACDLLGFTSADNVGYFGMEEYYNDQLNGTNGREYGYYDADLNIDRIVKKPVNGNSIISTIDANVQRIIQEQIVQFNNDIGSKNIGVLIMNPNNGEILAMSSNEEYNLNDPRKLDGIIPAEELAAMTDDQKMEALNALWKNDAISSSFEPGSTFKPITIAAALEEHAVNENDTFVCDGFEDIDGTIIHCSKRTGHGTVTLEQALMLSCNDALMQVVKKEGKDIFYRYQNSFGIGQKTGIDLPGENTGVIISEDKLNPVELATSSFGQAFTVTMVQLASAFSSLVNGGYYYQPHVVKEIVNDSGATVKKFDKLLVRQTVSKETSDFIQEAMYHTVEAGTATKAKVEGYSVGGKTGTAQKIPYADKNYIVSFLGAVPAINPEIVIYVMIDEPQNVVKQADSSIATKFASQILKQILPVLGIYPDGDIDYLLPTQAPEDTAAPGGTTSEATLGQQNTESRNSGTAENNGDTSGTQDIQEGTSPGDTGSENQTTEGGSEGTIDNQTGQNNTSGTGNNSGTAGNEDEFNPDVLDP